MRFREWLLTEVGVTLQQIVQQLPAFYSGKVPDALMSNMVYHYLTQGVGHQAVQNTMQNPQQYQQYLDVYRKIVAALDQRLAGMNWISDDSGAWIEWYRKGNHKGIKTNGQTSKRYISVNPQDGFKVLQGLAVLARKLDSVQTHPQADVIGFKIPTNVGVFFSHKDNIVIHFYDDRASQQIDQAVRAFLAEIGVQEMDRVAQGRTAFGQDANGTSDSDLVAKQVVRNLRANQAAIQQNPLAAVQHIIQQVSQNASHRKAIN